MKYLCPVKRSLFICMLSAIPLFIQAQWVNVGNSIEDIDGLGEFHKDIEINPFTGYPVVAYCDWATSKVMVKEYDGQNWNDVGNSNSSLNGNGEEPFDLTINHINGNYIIIYGDWPNDSLTVMKYDGINWNDLGESVSNLKAKSRKHIKVKVHPVTGNPYISYQRRYSEGVISFYYPKLKYYDGVNWLSVGNDSAFIFGKTTSHIYDFTFHPESNSPYALTGVNDFVVKKYDGTEWEQVGYDINGGYSHLNKGVINFHPITNEPYVLVNGTTLGQHNYFAYNTGMMEWQADFSHDALTTPPTSDKDLNFDFNSITGKRIVAGSYSNAVGVFSNSSGKWVELGSSVDSIVGKMPSNYRHHIELDISPLNNHPFLIYTDANSEKVKVKEYVCSTTSELYLEACDSLVSPSGNYTWKTSGTFMDTILNAEGCDSIITIHAEIHHSTFTQLQIEACETYTTPSGEYTYLSNGTYFDTLQTIHGCDSILELDVKILEPSTVEFTEVVCDSMVSPSGKYVWKETGTYYDTLVNSLGCDSIMQFNLTVNKRTSSEIDIIACETYTSPSGKYTWTNSGIYVDTVFNTSGCDSIITINLAIGHPVTVYDTTTYYVSDKLFEPVNSTLCYDTSYLYKSKLTNCDSIVQKYHQFIYKEAVYSDTTYITVEDTLKIQFAVTDLNSISQRAEIMVYPNPTKDLVKIKIENYNVLAGYEVQIFNESGSLLWNSLLDYEVFSIDISTLGGTGIYFLKVIDPKSDLITTRKILLY